MSDEHIERLIKEYADNYMGPVFYYCLRRTGDVYMAEDLTQDIAVQVLSSLKKGIKPQHFSAWVWKIVSNCYSKWAKQKHKDAVTDTLIDDNDLIDESFDPYESDTNDEQLDLIRRELAFIKKEYREIVVAYYIDDLSVREIAGMLSLTESSVKKRLERARIQLKEGMSMAKTFGKLSYQPENISFINNGAFGSNGEPWCYLNRMICKNILIASYRTPSTAEELALELGISLPYLEDEIESLVSATLMRKNGTRYEPTFPIISASAQGNIFSHLKSVIGELTQAVIRTVEYDVSCKNEHCKGWHEGYQPYDDMKWSLLMEECDRVQRYYIEPFNADQLPESVKLGKWGHTIRPNGGEWDILGLENYEGEMPAFVGKHGCMSSSEKNSPYIDFSQYKFQYKDIGRKTPEFLDYTDGQALIAVAKKDIASVDPAVLRRLEKFGYIEKINGTYQPTFLVMFRDNNKSLTKEDKEKLNELRNDAIRISKEHYQYCREQIVKEIPDFLKKDSFQIYNACTTIVVDFRGAVLEEAIRVGYINYSANDTRRMLGAVLKI